MFHAIDSRWQFQRSISPFPAIPSKCDSLHFHPIALPRSFHSTQSWANVAQRLMQVACNIAYSFLRLITSDNDTASIMDKIIVSISPAIIANHSGSSCSSYTMRHAARWHSRDYTKHDAGKAWHGRVRNLFFYRTATPAPLHPTQPTRARPNAETPPPIKTAILYVNIVY